jgi:hypothetical protein
VRERSRHLSGGGKHFAAGQLRSGQPYECAQNRIFERTGFRLQKALHFLPEPEIGCAAGFHKGGPLVRSNFQGGMK